MMRQGDEEHTWLSSIMKNPLLASVGQHCGILEVLLVITALDSLGHLTMATRV